MKIYLLFVFLIFSSVSTSHGAIIKNINVIGNVRIDKETILANANLQLNQTIQDDDLNNAVKSLYGTNYFSDIKIDINDNDLNIRVLENPFINEIFFTGDIKINTDEIEKQLSLRTRSPYSRAKIKRDLDALYGLYQKTGNLNVNIEPRVVFLPENRVDIIFNIDEGESNYISDIIFVGNKSFYDFTLAGLLSLKTKNSFDIVGSFLGKSKFEEDKVEVDKDAIKTWYLSNGYANFKINSVSAVFNPINYNVVITYFLEEGEKYNINNINVNATIPDLDINNILNNKIKSKKHAIYNKTLINQDVQLISDYIASLGFSNVAVDVIEKKDDINQVVDLDFSIHSSVNTYINKINISGNNSTLSEVILRELYIHEGDSYDANKIAISKDRLIMLGYFKKVDFKETFSKDNRLVDIEIIVEEQFFGNVNFSIGYSNLEGVIGTAQLQINNLFGRGYSTGINAYRSGFSQRYGFNFYNPYFFGKHNIGFGFDVYYSGYGQLGGIGVASMLANYPINGQTIGFNFSLGFELTHRLNYQAGIGYMVTNSGVISGYSITPIYASLMGDRSAMSFNHSITWNFLDQARYAKSGFILTYAEKYAGLGNQQFIARSASGKFYLPLFRENIILFAAIEGGLVQNLGSHFVGMESLYSLGYYKMRGFSFFGLGPHIVNTYSDGQSVNFMYGLQGQYYYYGTFEIRSPLFVPKEYGLMFVAFCDYGSVWGVSLPSNMYSYQYVDASNPDNNYTSTIVDNSNILRLSVGGGIIWQSPMGEIGLFYGQPILRTPHDVPMTFNIRMGTQF